MKEIDLKWGRTGGGGKNQLKYIELFGLGNFNTNFNSKNL
jgi:hypothetical protein